MNINEDLYEILETGLIRCKTCLSTFENENEVNEHNKINGVLN